ncbi:MAG: ISL3 family transposase, partial [Rhizomicrobium sp.]
MQNQLFEAALGIAKPWYVNSVNFDALQKTLTISVDFVAGTRFAAPGVTGVHPVHDTQ